MFNRFSGITLVLGVHYTAGGGKYVVRPLHRWVHRADHWALHRRVPFAGAGAVDRRRSGCDGGIRDPDGGYSNPAAGFELELILIRARRAGLTLGHAAIRGRNQLYFRRSALLGSRLG